MADVRGPAGAAGAHFGNPASAEPAATVRVGEATLSDVARRLNIGADVLLRANPQIKDPNALSAGQEIRLPQKYEAPAGPADTAADSGVAAPPAGLAGSLSDPLLASLAHIRLKRDSPSAPPPGGIAMYAQDGGAAGAAPAKAGPSVAGDVAGLLAEGAKVAGAKEAFTAAQKAIAGGDYRTAYAKLEELMRTNGEDVLSEQAVKGTQTVRDQVEFLAGMQKAGISADYPPTEAQLTEYFKTFRNDPDGARRAFKDYTQLFHVHPANLQGRDFDVKYSDDKNPQKTRVPDDWSEVANRASNDRGKHIGKQVNDCEGFAFMAEKLLGAAGFKLAHQITAYPGPNDAGHSMAAFTHPNEKGFTVTSNDGVFHGNTEKAAAVKGLEYGAGKTTGAENYYIGKTMAESQIQVANQGRKL